MYTPSNLLFSVPVIFYLFNNAKERCQALTRLSILFRIIEYLNTIDRNGFEMFEIIRKTIHWFWNSTLEIQRKTYYKQITAPVSYCFTNKRSAA